MIYNTKYKEILKNLKALNITELVLFINCILPCKHNCVQYTTLYHVYATNTYRLRWRDQSYITRHRL